MLIYTSESQNDPRVRGHFFNNYYTIIIPLLYHYYLTLAKTS